MTSRSLETTEWQVVHTKARKRYPSVPTCYSADVHKKQLIRIRDDETQVENEFKMGNLAEYNSWNKSYYGYIVGITEKRVTIVCRFQKKAYDRGDNPSKHSLDLETFCRRNIKWSESDASKSNAEWYD